MSATAGTRSDVIPPAGSILPWLILGALTAIGGSVAWWLCQESLPPLLHKAIHPLASLGHGIALGMLVTLWTEARRLSRCRRELGEFPAGANWAALAWQRYQQELSIPDKFSPEEYQKWAPICWAEWSDRLRVRFHGYLVLLTLPALLGLAQGLLNLPARGKLTAPPLGELLPCVAGTLETVLLLVWNILLMLGWNRLLVDLREKLREQLANTGLTLIEEKKKLESEKLELARERAQWEALLRSGPAPVNPPDGGLAPGSPPHSPYGNGSVDETRPSHPEVIEPVDAPDY